VSLLTHRPTTTVFMVFTLGYLSALAVALVWLRFGPERILILTLGSIGIGVMALRPYIAVQIFLFVLFFENSLAKIGDITVMKALGAITLAGWLASILIQRRLGLQWSAMLLTMLIFLAWMGVCVPGAFEAGTALVQFTSYLQLGLAAIMLNSVIRSQKHLRGVLIGFILWTLVSTIIAIIMYYAGITRVAIGLVGNRNLLALYINLAVVCALLILPTLRTRLGQAGIALALPILFLGLALTLSRTAIVIMAMALLIVWYRLAREQGMLILLGSAATIAALLFLLPTAFWQRTESIVPAIERREDTFGLRLRIWEVGQKMIDERPILGVGPGNFPPASQRYARGEILGRGLASHNMYINVATETGLVGLGLFLTLMVFAVLSAWRAMHRARDHGLQDLAHDAIAVEMMIWVMLGQGLTGDHIIQKSFWLILGLSLTVDGLTRPLVKTAAAPASTTARTLPDGAGA
jgi:O-antigen ligase